MSVNLGFDFIITGFTDFDQANLVVEAIAEVMRDELIHDQGVGFGSAMLDDEIVVTGETSSPLSITRAHLWRSEFEEQVAAAARDVVPDTNTKFNWHYPDLDQ